MEGQAVKEIAGLEDKAKTIVVDGQTFARAEFKPVMFVPRAAALKGKTLTGLVDYIKANREKIDIEDLMIQVVDHARVDLVEIFSGADVKRTTFYIAELDDHLPEFRFGSYMGVEEFIIQSRALFQPTEDLGTVVAIVSRVVQQDEITAADDGLSQTVQVKKGVSGALSQGIQTKGVYELRPFRTFRELQQPVSKFILRLKAMDGQLPTVALFDAEGEAWRYQAMQDVKAFLDSKELHIPVFA
jgi:hypothetical protein